MANKADIYKERSKKYFDKISDKYFDTWDGKYSSGIYEELIKVIRLHSFQSVLDVGCGTGTLLEMIIREFDDIRAAGLDISEKMIEKAEELLGDQVQLIVGDSENLPWHDSSFDLLICNSSFHHYPKPANVLGEMKRVLKPDGRLVISDPWWTKPTRWLANLCIHTPFNYGGDVRIYDREDISGLLTEAGFRSVEWTIQLKKYYIATANK